MIHPERDLVFYASAANFLLMLIPLCFYVGKLFQEGRNNSNNAVVLLPATTIPDNGGVVLGHMRTPPQIRRHGYVVGEG